MIYIHLQCGRNWRWFATTSFLAGCNPPPAHCMWWVQLELSICHQAAVVSSSFSFFFWLAFSHFLSAFFLSCSFSVLLPLYSIFSSYFDLYSRSLLSLICIQHTLFDSLNLVLRWRIAPVNESCWLLYTIQRRKGKASQQAGLPIY